MPLFQYRCSSKRCKHEFEEFFHRREDGMTAACPKCKKPARRLLQAGRFCFATGSFFEPHWNEDLDREPIFIRSQDHFHEECRKRNLVPRKMPPKLK